MWIKIYHFSFSWRIKVIITSVIWAQNIREQDTIVIKNIVLLLFY